MNWIKHIKTNLLALLPLLIIITWIGCNDKIEEKEAYLAEVGDSRLTEGELNLKLGNGNTNPKYKEEIIRDWIETEVLNHVAKSKNLLSDENFDNVIEASKKELAASIAINDFLTSTPVKYSDSEIRKYYDQNKEDFNFVHDAYILNFIEFEDEQSAIDFRDNAISNGWTYAIEKAADDSTIINSQINKIYKLSEIQSKRIHRILQKLNNSEISLVIKTELNNFVIVQQNDLIRKNTIPNFRFVKEDVERSYITMKQRESIRKYLDSLINVMKVKVH